MTARHRSGPGHRVEDVVRRPWHARPGPLGDLAGELTGRPARVTGEHAQTGQLLGQVGRVGVQVDEVDVTGDPSQRTRPRRRPRPARSPGTARCRSRTGRPRGTRSGSTARSHQPGSTSRISTWLGRPRTTPSVPVSEWSSTYTTVPANVGSVSDGIATSRVPGQTSSSRPDGECRDGGGAPPTGRRPRRRPGLGIGGSRHRRHRCQCAPPTGGREVVAPTCDGSARSASARRMRCGARGPAVTVRTPPLPLG